MTVNRDTLPWALTALGVYWLALIYQLGAQWTVYPQYNYGWSVPFLCAYLIWQKFRAPQVSSQRSDPGSGIPAPPAARLPLLLIALCALLYAPTRFFHEANPIWRLTSLLWTIEVIVISLCLLPLAGLGSGATRQNLFFPVSFFLVAVPWPSGLEAWLVQTLTRLNVSAAVEVLGWLGIPVLQHGNVMEVAGGEVGVDEACSGIRSFQATLMIALFLGEVHRLSRLRRTAAVLAGFLYSFLFNLVRTTLLTAVAARKGITAVAAWHDPAGVTILVGCFLMLWLTTVWLGRQRKDPKGGGGNANDIVEPTTLRPAPGPGVRAFPVRWAAIALVAWLIMVEVGTQTWFRLHETNTLPQKSWSVSISDPDSGLTREDVPASISRQFRADEGLEAHGRDSAADYWQLFYFRWFPSRSLHERVAVQLAKTHGPEVCLPAMGMTMDSDLGIITVPVGGRTFAFHQYTFLAAGQKIHVFYAIYEDQTGSAALASRRQDTRSRVAAALAGSRNHGQQYLELAVNGPADPEAARVELGNELARIIVNE